jgi:hypothetical protein
MNKIIIRIMLILFLLNCGVSMAQAEERRKPQGRMKSPPEAIAACQGKSEGATVQFTTSRGETLNGVCKDFEGILTAMPGRGALTPKGDKPD